MTLAICKTRNELDAALAPFRRAGQRVALVPTMGALHAGHMSLVEIARKNADVVVLYIFVNPRQFRPNEDFGSYPRTWDADVQQCTEAGVDVLYAPDADDVYPPGYSTTVSVGELGNVLEGTFRPGFFDGVATVLSKFFLRVLPDVAVFGEKDYQQLQVIRRFVRDLDMPVEVIGAPTVREASGLAMSSRNTYLQPEAREKHATAIYAMLNETAEKIKSRPAEVKAALASMEKRLQESGFKVDYVSLADAKTLVALDALDRPARLLVAAWLGTTRLIDNIEVIGADHG